MEHWREVGFPDYAQFDNDMIFQGTHRYADALGRVIRLCLSLAVVPVFVPPREMGFQAMIESYNGWWQARVWSRFQHANLGDLQQRSSRHVRALWAASGGAALEAAPKRRPFPAGWELDLKKRPLGRLIYLRRTNAQGEVTLLGRTWPVSVVWPSRLVRSVKWIWTRTRSASSPSASQPSSQPQILEVDYRLPNRGFQDDRPVRDVLALVSIRATKCSGRTGTCPVTGVKTNTITAVIIAGRDAHETSPMFKPLVEATAEHFTVKEVPADKAYLSRESLDLLHTMGGTAFVPFKSNSTAGEPGSCGSGCSTTTSSAGTKFLKHYHQRSNVESTFSMVKAKFRDHVRSKTDVAMTNESLPASSSATTSAC